MLEWWRHIFGAAMINSENSKPKVMDVPAFLRDPRPSERLRCPTLLVAWLRSSREPSASELEPKRRSGDANEDHQ